jgi:DNA-binding NarL/FixJ family response regulator
LQTVAAFVKNSPRPRAKGGEKHVQDEPRSRGPILIVDGDDAVARSISELLDGAGYGACVVPSGEEALAFVRQEPPGLVILEVCLPGISGYEVCRVLRELFGPGLPIIFISSVRTESYDRVAGLLVGADEYLTKPIAPDELLIHVRRLLRRPAPLPASIAARLTKREREVLSLLAEGFDLREIAARLVLSPKTVATHIEHILGKLGVHSRAQAVALAYRSDLVDKSQLGSPVPPG